LQTGNALVRTRVWERGRLGTTGEKKLGEGELKIGRGKILDKNRER